MVQSIPTRTTSPDGEEIKQFARNLAPFEPPPEYRFEPEFEGPPPRPIPLEVRNGRYCRGGRLRIIGFLSAGIVLIACGMLPIMQTWGLYVLPFQYLHWIGAFLLGVSGVVWARSILSRGPFVYIEDGTPIVARIVMLFLRVKTVVNGTPSVFQYVVVFQHRDPDTSELVFSSDTYDVSALTKEAVTLSYHVGDYVTAVYLRTNRAAPLRLYGFLDMRPNLGLIRRSTSQEWTTFRLIATIVGMGGIFFALFWNLYALGKFEPLEMSFREHAAPFVLGAVLLGGVLISFFIREARQARKRLRENNEKAEAEGGAIELEWQPKIGLFGQGPIMSIILLLGSGLMGGATMLCWAFTLNALADSSPPAPRPVAIHDMWMKTHSFVFREYTIEYQFSDDKEAKKRELMTTPWHIASFGPNPVGVAEVRQGFLGWPWVETITPVVANDEKQKPGATDSEPPR